MAPILPFRAKRADDQTRAADDGQRAAGFRELVDDRAVAARDRHDHGDRAENGDERNRDVADERQRLDAEVRRSGHARAGDDDERPFRRGAAAEQLVCDRNGEHGDADTEPADLREGDHRRGKIRALAAEGLAREQVKAHAGLRADVAEQAGVQAEDEAADDERDEEAAEIQTVGQLLTDPHARREKGEAEHDHEHGHDAAARVLRHRRLRKVDIYRRLFFFH